MCAYTRGVATSEQIINYDGSASYDPSPSDNLSAQFPVNVVPHPGSQHGSHTKWQLLEASREHWNPNELEPLTSTGVSPLLAFTERREGILYCIVPTKTGLCNYKNVKKGRMLSHIRKDHLNFRPFPCIGQCGTQGCPQRFPCAAALKEHTAPRKVECPCGKVLYAQNLIGHQTKCQAVRIPP